MCSGRIDPTFVLKALAEGAQLAETITGFVEEVRALGPLRWPARPRPAPVVEALEPAEAAEATP